MRILIFAAMIGLSWWVREAAPYVIVGCTTALLMVSVYREEKLEKRVRQLEAELGYVARSRRSLSEFLRDKKRWSSARLPE